MKKGIIIIGISILCILPFIGSAQNSSLWFPRQNRGTTYLRPITPVWGVSSTKGFSGGTLSGDKLYIRGVTSCSQALETDSVGEVICGTDDTSAGSGTPGGNKNEIQFNNGASNFGGSTKLTFNSGSGLMEVSSTMSGWNLKALDSLTSSGTLSIEGNASFQSGVTCTDCIALTTETSGNYALGDGEAGNATSGDSGDAFFAAGTVDLDDGGTNANLTAVNGGLVYSTASAFAISTAGTAGQVLRSNGASAPTWGAVRGSGSLVWYFGSGSVRTSASMTFVLPVAVTARNVDIQADEAPTGAAMIVDLNEAGTTIFSTRPQVNDGANTEAGTHVFSDTALAAGSAITLDLDQVGSTFKGEQVTVILHFSYVNVVSP